MRVAKPARLWPHSLIARVVLSQGVLIVLAAIGVWEIGGWQLRHAVVLEQRRVLVEQARQIAQGYRGGDKVDLPPSLELAYDSSYDGRAFVIITVKRGPVAGSRYADGIPWERVPTNTHATSFSIAPFGGISMPFTHGKRQYWVVVTQDESGPGVILHRVIAQSMHGFAVLIVLLLLAFGLFDYILVRSLIGKVAQASDGAAAIGPKNLAARLDEQGLPSEVGPLVHAINDLLDRLEASFTSQSQFVGNVVHELRTPLATLRLQARDVDAAPVRARLEDQVDRISHVITQLRHLALLDSAPQLGEEVRLDDLARDVVVELAPRALDSGHTIALETQAPGATVIGNPTLLSLALINLVANAIDHTPRGTAIRVGVGPRALSVEDDGPGITLHDREHLTRRYWRADRKRSDNAGIGLAIVHRIMELNGGRLEIFTPPEGGAGFSLIFAH